MPSISTIFLLGSLAVFFLLIILLPLVSREIIRRKVKAELKKHGCCLISIKNTHKRFRYTAPREGWKRFVLVNHIPAQSTTFKEVTFSSREKQFTCLVAIDTFLGFVQDVTFEYNLNRLPKML